MRNFYFLPTVVIVFLYTFSTSFLFSQDLQWQRSLGGKQSEYLFDALPTPDDGFILAGSSVSEVSGTKQEENRGSLDYFLWKMNAQGHEEWQRSLGGNQSDFLYSINLTRDGGYILGGSSYSGISGDKKDSCRGLDDYWIVKLNARGQEEWQKTLGGTGSDQLLSIQQTSDLGYIIGGSSDSPVSNEKTEPNRGSMDFWIIKLDKSGKTLWQKTLGGSHYDLLRSIKETKDGYILAGYSNSPKNEDKNEDVRGEGDYWLVKLDTNGKVVWEKTIGGERNDELMDLIFTKDGGYLLAGNSNSPQGGMKTVSKGEGSDIWLVKTDELGDIEWQQTLDIGKADQVSKVVEDQQGSFLVAGNTQSMSQEGEIESDYVAVKVSSKGEILWKKRLGGDKNDRLKSAIETRNGSLVLAGTSDSGKARDKSVEGKGQSDFWIVKLKEGNSKKEDVRDKRVEVYPNPTERFVNVIIHEQLKGHENIQVYDISGKLLQQNKVKYSTTPIDLMGYSPGVYVLSVLLTDGNTETVKILKQGNK